MCKPIKRHSHVEVLGALADACYTFPKLRVGQLIDNAVISFKGLNGPSSESSPDLFYAEDEYLCRALRWYCVEFGPVAD